MVFRAQAEEIGRSLGYTPEDFHEAWAYQMRTLYEGPAIVPQNGANDNGYEQGGQVQSPWTASSRDVRVNPSHAFRPISAADAQSTIRTNRHRVERGNEPEGRGDPVPRGDLWRESPPPQNGVHNASDYNSRRPGHDRRHDRN